MKILALEFSSAQRSVAVVNRPDGRAHLEVAEVVETGGSATRPFEMIAEALRQGRIEREQIECVAVGLGPGSYNGIRSAIAVAQGWNFAAGTKLIGISSVDCLLAQAKEAGRTGSIHIVIDAQRTEFYLASFELGTAESATVAPLRIVNRAEIQALEKTGEEISGPEVTRWFPRGRDLFPRAAVLGQLSLDRKEFVLADKLEPIYLRETAFVKAPPPRARF